MLRSYNLVFCFSYYSFVNWEQHISLKVGLHNYSLSVSGIKEQLINSSDAYSQCYVDKLMGRDIYS